MARSLYITLLEVIFLPDEYKGSLSVHLHRHVKDALTGEN
jgi:hypothetical protein